MIKSEPAIGSGLCRIINKRIDVPRDIVSMCSVGPDARYFLQSQKHAAPSSSPPMMRSAHSWLQPTYYSYKTHIYRVAFSPIDILHTPTSTATCPHWNYITIPQPNITTHCAVYKPLSCTDPMITTRII